MPNGLSASKTAPLSRTNASKIAPRRQRKKNLSNENIRNDQTGHPHPPREEGPVGPHYSRYSHRGRRSNRHHRPRRRRAKLDFGTNFEDRLQYISGPGRKERRTGAAIANLRNLSQN